MPSRPLIRVAIWGLALNAAWELVQCTVLYDMWSWGVARAGLYMLAAIIGDVGIVLGVLYLSTEIVGVQHLRPLDVTGWLGTLAIGLVAALFLEWLARVVGLWGYSDLMPTITILEHTVGVSPVVQVTILPALSLFMATRRTSSP